MLEISEWKILRGLNRHHGAGNWELGTGIQATNQYQYGVDVTTLTHSHSQCQVTIQLDVSATLIDQHGGVRSARGNDMYPQCTSTSINFEP